MMTHDEIEALSDEELIKQYNEHSALAIIWDNRQTAQKLALNSAYGAFGNVNFRLYELNVAESITLFGQVVVKNCAYQLEKYLQETIKPDHKYYFAGDTDSMYIDLSPIWDKIGIDKIKEHEKAKKFLMKYADNHLQDRINEYLTNYASYLNVKNIITMDREALSIRGGFWVAKKKYSVIVDNLEGVDFEWDKPYVKTMGLELIKAAAYTPFIRDSLKVILNDVLFNSESDCQGTIKKLKKEFSNQNIDDIAFLKAVNEIDKWVDDNGDNKSGTPIQVKSVLNYRKFVDVFKLDLPIIQEGDKILYVYLKKNPLVPFETIGFVEWDDQLETLRDYIDMDLMFSKNLLAPASIMIDAVKWKTEKKKELF